MAFLEENKVLFGAAWDEMAAVFTESSFLILSFVVDLIAIISAEGSITDLTAITTLTSDAAFWKETLSFELVSKVVLELTTDISIQSNLVAAAIVSLTSISVTDVIVDLTATLDIYQIYIFEFINFNINSAGDEAISLQILLGIGTLTFDGSLTVIEYMEGITWVETVQIEIDRLVTSESIVSIDFVIRQISTYLYFSTEGYF